MARNKINDLRDHLFETLERLKEGDIDIATAKAMADVGQVIINSAKIEIDFIKATGSTKDGVGLQMRNEAIACALIAVDEIISVMDNEMNFFDYLYFKEVKTEIQKL